MRAILEWVFNLVLAVLIAFVAIGALAFAVRMAGVQI